MPTRAIEKIKIINLLNGKYQFPATFGTLVFKADGVTQFCEQDAQVNVLEGVTLNSSDLTVTNKKISLSLSMAEKSTPNPGYAATYQLLINGTAVGDDIDIPLAGTGLVSVTFDTVTAADKASGGKFEYDTNYSVGDPYLDFLLADTSHLYCNLKDAVKTYTAGNGLTLNNGVFAVDTSVVALQTDIPTALSQLSEDSTHRTVTDTEKSTWSGKQDALVSGTNIKTINNESILGSGNITVGGGTATDVQVNGTSITSNNVANIVTEGTYNASTNKIATMSDLPSVPVTDVTVGGTSVVSSGTAVIPAIPDISNLIAKSSTAGLVKNDGTIDTNTYLTQHQDITGKADKVSGATSGDLAGLDANGNLTDSGITGTSVSTAVTNSHTHSNKSLLDTYTQSEANLADAVSKKHSHSNKTLLDMLPSTLGSAGQALCTNTNADGTEWKTVGGGGSATDVQINSTSITIGGVANIVTETAYNDSTNKIATYKDVHPTTGSSQPAGGMLPNTLYTLGTLSGSVSIALASPTDNTICNHYYFTFDADSTAPTITWDAAITSWNGGSAPTITASKHYEISVLDGVATFMEV